MSIVRKLLGSSTLWVVLLLPALKFLFDRLGVEIPWEVVAGGQVAYGVKEGGAKIGSGKP